MSIENQIREAHTAIAQTQQRVTRAQVAHDQALESRNQASKVLKEEFGVTSRDDARQKLQELRDELNNELASIHRDLEIAGA